MMEDNGEDGINESTRTIRGLLEHQEVEVDDYYANTKITGKQDMLLDAMMELMTVFSNYQFERLEFWWVSSSILGVKIEDNDGVIR